MKEEVVLIVEGFDAAAAEDGEEEEYREFMKFLLDDG